jgi:hypothetical protein
MGGFLAYNMEGLLYVVSCVAEVTSSIKRIGREVGWLMTMGGPYWQYYSILVRRSCRKTIEKVIAAWTFKAVAECRVKCTFVTVHLLLGTKAICISIAWAHKAYRWVNSYLSDRITPWRPDLQWSRDLKLAGAEDVVFFSGCHPAHTDQIRSERSSLESIWYLCLLVSSDSRGIPSYFQGPLLWPVRQDKSLRNEDFCAGTILVWHLEQ